MGFNSISALKPEVRPDVKPEVRSEVRPEVDCENANRWIADPTFHEFGSLGSTIHNASVRYNRGRLKRDFHCSAGTVHNNFPWLSMRPISPDSR